MPGPVFPTGSAEKEEKGIKQFDGSVGQSVYTKEARQQWTCLPDMQSLLHGSKG